MRKIIFLSILYSLSIVSSPLWGDEACSTQTDVEMRRHRHHHKSHSHHRSHSNSRGKTGPTGPKGATGAPGVTGVPGSLSPSFGSFYSTTGQDVPPGGAIFFENTGAGPIGTAFTFTPEPGPVPAGTEFNIVETGYYSISYGVFGSAAGTSTTGAEGAAIGLLFNSAGLTGSFFHPGDSFLGSSFYQPDKSMPEFIGIFTFSTPGVLQLVNISNQELFIVPPSSAPTFGGPPDSDISAYINIQFLMAD